MRGRLAYCSMTMLSEVSFLWVFRAKVANQLFLKANRRLLCCLLSATWWDFSNQIREKCVSHLGQLYVQWLLDCAALVFDNHILESALLSQNFLSYSISCRCNFETGLCDLTQLANDTFNWRRQAGRTGSFGTGPSFDHTTESSNGKTWSLFIPLYTSQHPNMVKLKAWIFKRAETLLAL